ncbi:hypothetical protein [Allorhizocola rhizosphaerae]|uniref:hypothetical protein n=1 Tax=Allorhizocola rhizosphaerae TaxID=1872709 RepID=UPI001B8DAA72|nr:hypothetical protein [Allorhizocola rhizosphaerae]
MPSNAVAVDEHGRSAQTFFGEVVARAGGMERREVAGGRDNYAVTARLVGRFEGLSRLAAG